MKYFYLSFAGEEGFRGGCVVEADDFLSAISEAHRLGINPHGQVKGQCISDPGPLPINKLLLKSDIDNLDKAVKWT